jgi:hypothetical protein
VQECWDKHENKCHNQGCDENTDKCHTKHNQECSEDFDNQCTTTYNQECWDEYSDQYHTEHSQVSQVLSRFFLSNLVPAEVLGTKEVPRASQRRCAPL